MFQDVAIDTLCDQHIDFEEIEKTLRKAGGANYDAQNHA